MHPSEELRRRQRRTRRRSQHSNRGCRMICQLERGSDRPPNEFTATVCTHETQLCRSTLRAVGALEGADVCLSSGWQIPVAAFAVGSNFEGHIQRLAASTGSRQPLISGPGTALRFLCGGTVRSQEAAAPTQPAPTNPVGFKNNLNVPEGGAKRAYHSFSSRLDSSDSHRTELTPLARDSTTTLSKSV
jgi:hypothetical protein